MFRIGLLTLALIGTLAGAEDLITIRPSFNFRRVPNKLRPPLRTIRVSTSAVLLDSRGPWRKVCIGGAGPECTGGDLGWVHRRGVTSSAPVDAQDSASECFGAECARRPKQSPIQAIEPIAESIGKNPTGYTLPANFPKACSTFISARGWGEWGRIMDRAVNKVSPSCLYGADLFGSICPNYGELSIQKKNALIALTFAAMGYKESTCGLKLEAQGVNGAADGMFQMERDRKLRHGPGQRSKRSVRWCRTETELDTKQSTFQSECSISIIEDTICKKNRQINHPSGYWAKLRGEGKITQLIRSTARQWRLCRTHSQE